MHDGTFLCPPYLREVSELLVVVVAAAVVVAVVVVVVVEAGRAE
jgi:hypothetical protein